VINCETYYKQFSASETIELHKLIKNKMIDSFKLLEKRIENLLEKF